MINAEIISCDSMQIYKGMDIITSKPSQAQRGKVTHHLIDVVSPRNGYDVSRYRSQALKKIETLFARGKTPLFVGGTGLYLAILLDGIFNEKVKDAAVRRRLFKEAEKSGGEYLYRRLKKADSAAAGKIHGHDIKRIVRALEIYEVTGKPISRLQKKRQGLGSEYDVRIYGLTMEREKLYRQIEKRVDAMFTRGLMREVKKLLSLPLSKTARYAIGIRELKDFFCGACDLERAKELIKRNTRRYAKRQLTWFRKDKRIEWITIKDGEKPLHVARRIVKKNGEGTVNYG